MHTIHPSPLLKFALLADAAVSGAVATLQVSLPQQLAALLQLPHALLLDTGIFLVGYVALLIVLACSRHVWSWLIGFIAIGNVGWAVGCLGLLASDAISPNTLGISFIALQAITVSVFAVLQFKGLKGPPQFGGEMAVAQ